MAGTIQLTGGPPPTCAGDLNADQQVNITDFGLFVGAFGTPCSCCPADIDGIGTVNVGDFGLLVGAFGSACG